MGKKELREENIKLKEENIKLKEELDNMRGLVGVLSESNRCLMKELEDETIPHER